jgi:DNA-binding transcriptional ArsR family regulator
MKETKMGGLAEERPLAARLADVLKALAHPARLRIVAILCEGEESVIGLSEKLDLKQAIVSQQLRILRMSRLVAATRQDGFSRYALAEPRLRDLVTCLEGCHQDVPAETVRIKGAFSAKTGGAFGAKTAGAVGAGKGVMK